MTCRLVAFDLDGTLLDSKKRISQENLRALTAAAERGAVIVPATGRILRAIPPELRELPFIRYYILSNGAAVYDTAEERMISRGDIPLALALRVMEFLDTQPVLYDCYQNEIGLMTKSMYDRTPEYFREEPEILKLVLSLRIPVPDLKETLRERGEDIQKLQFFYRPEDNAERLRMIARFPALFPELSATSSTSNNVEVNSIRAGKGNGLLALCAALGIAPEDCMAFGDGTNDASLLRAAGRGVAMANAAAEVIAAADAVCESNEESGVGKEIQRILGGK